MSYRIEVSVSARAVCQATKCSKDKIKIAKGEIRQGTLVTTPEFTTMRYRHWGCVTPTVLHNWWETAEHNIELVDGFDELPEPAQEQVQRAFEQGHVDDKDWNGDIECNRYDASDTNQGMFLKGAKLKAKQAAMAAENGEEVPEQTKPAKKRARATADDQAETPAKKAKSKKAVTIADEDEDTKPVRKAKAKTADEDTETVVKKGKARSKAPFGSVKPESEVESADDTPAPKKTRGKAKKSAAADTEVPKANSKKSTTLDDAEPAPKKGRTKAKVKHEDPGSTENDQPKAKTTRRRKSSSED